MNYQQKKKKKNLLESKVEREVGGGIGMGNTCKPMADSFQCMTKSTTIKKKLKKYYNSKKNIDTMKQETYIKV